ncbi:unnamed protein product, partial [marine sediment metagenome]
YYLEQGGEIPIVGFTPDGDYPVVNSEKGIIFFDAIKVFRNTHSSITIKYIKGGLFLGIVENLSSGFISSNYKSGISLLFLVLVLLFSPKGLLSIFQKGNLLRKGKSKK